MKKKEDNGNDFGFGSPSQTFYLINFLMKTDKDKAIDLYNWVAANDGNYYITSNVTYKENEENEKMRAKNRAIILLDDQKKHLEAVARKKIKQELHLKKSLEKIKPYPEFKKRFQKMNDEQLLDALKEEKGKQGFVKARGYFISYLREEIKIRGLD